MTNDGNDWIRLNPELGDGASARRSFDEAARLTLRALSDPTRPNRREAVANLRRDVSERIDEWAGGSDPTALRLAVAVLLDLVEHGWELRLDDGGVAVRRPEYAADDRAAAKQRIKESELCARDAQLDEPSVRSFVSEMETRRLTSAGWISIFNLMRDGQELGEALKRASEIADHESKQVTLRGVIRPYLQFVTEDAVCGHTGLRLVDIWRYFRMTWSTAHKSTPGRRMMILVRDAAAPFHPVIGIAALSSPVVQLTCRDEWIGWDSSRFANALREKPTAKLARWILTSLDRAIKDIYRADFLKDRTLTVDAVRCPTRDIIARLLRESKEATKDHQLFPRAADIKALQTGQAKRSGWEQLARSALYRGKRAKALARILTARQALQNAGFTRPRKRLLVKALEHGSARRAIGTILREVKAKNVGVGMMDITVCGAVAPYNALLGGKLVSILMASPEVVLEYRRRYSTNPSVIASSMKGKAVVRRPRLVLLGTTSLYMTGSSQYNRIKIPAEAIGGVPGQHVAYVPLGETLGYGSFHFSKETLRLIEVFVARSKNGRRVNSIFGEGVNPRLRKLRQGFDELGLPQELLRHGSPRLVFMVPLASNFRDILMDLARRPRFLIPLPDPHGKTERIAEFWRTRWLSGRIERDGILESVRRHNLSYPVRHGARVALPQGAQATQLPDFVDSIQVPS